MTGWILASARILRFKAAIAVVLGFGAAIAEPAHGHEDARARAELAVVWFDALYDLVRDTPGYTPLEASRAYAYCGVTMYEALAHGMRDGGWVPERPTPPSHARYRSLAGQLNALPTLPKPSRKPYAWPVVANAAMRTVALHFFPSSSDAVEAIANGFFEDYVRRLRRPILDRSVEYGEELGSAILDWAAKDGFAEMAERDAAAVAPDVPGAWVGTGTGLHPAWGTLRTFALPSTLACPAQAPPAFSQDTDSAWYAHALVVYNTTGGSGAKLSADQRDIARFWSDAPGATGTPPGHWVSILGIVARQHDLELGVVAEGYARIGLSAADALIDCWQTKFATFLMRPITYIQNRIDSSWRPLLATPNFPTYTSGHSTQSGATQLVLTDLLGTVPFVDTTHVDHDNAAVLSDLTTKARPFRSLFQAAKEAMTSRLYGGIHYGFDNELGFQQGVCVGETILKHVRFRD